MGGKHLLQPGPVHRHQLAFGHRHGGGHPGLPVEERGLPDQLSGMGKGKNALVPLRRGDEAFHRTRDDIVKALRQGVLEVDELARLLALDGLAVSQGGPGVAQHSQSPPFP